MHAETLAEYCVFTTMKVMIKQLVSASRIVRQLSNRLITTVAARIKLYDDLEIDVRDMRRSLAAKVSASFECLSLILCIGY